MKCSISVSHDPTVKLSLWPLLVFGIVISLLLSACRPNGVLRLTPGTPPPTPKESPTPAPTWTPAPRRLEPFIALCLVKTDARGVNFYTSPDETSEVLRTLKNREVLTVTVRSLDQTWVRGQSKDNITGWVQAQSAACTVPIHELYVAKETGTILDVTATAAVVSSATALVAGTPSATATNTRTPRPQTATPTYTPAPSPTAIPPSNTPQPTPTASPTRVPEIECTVVITKGLNVRIGPGTEFRAFVKLAENDVFVAVGQNADGTWLAGRAQGNRPGWVIVTSVRCASDYTQLAIVPSDVVLQQITPTPTETLAATEIPQQPTLAPTRIVATTTLPVATTGVGTTPVVATPVVATPVGTTTKPSATATLTATAAPKVTATTPALTPGLQCSVVVSTGIYLRTGPARSFPPQVVAAQGEIFFALARTANNTWLLGRNQTGVVGWSIAGGIRCSVPIKTLPVSRQILPTRVPNP